MVTNIIHFIWIGPPMPDWVQANIGEFRRLNPDYEMRIHGEEVLVPGWQKTYSRLTNICTKADLLAMSALQRYGGWYFDTDYWPFRPVRSIVESYGLEDGRMFVTEQHGQMNANLTVANGVMAAEPDWPGWPLVNGTVEAPEHEVSRNEFGPEMLTRMAGEHPRLFTIGAWPWFYPAEIGRAARIYKRCVEMGPAFARTLSPAGGQIPFMLHLWAGGLTVLKPRVGSDEIARVEGNPAGRWAGLNVCMALVGAQWRDETQPIAAVGEGLAKLGCTVEVMNVQGDRILDLADLVIFWNGRKGHYRTRLHEAEARGIPILRMEHGFFERRAHIHIDPKGILHWASWADRLTEPAPPEGAARLAKVWPEPLVPFRDRRGYILALGQVSGDSQMDDSEIQSALGFERLLWRHCKGFDVYWRSHPNGTRERHRHLPLAPGPSLREAVAGALCAVMVNSNAGNECLAWGCPVLCLGPALYAKAGVAKQAGTQNIRAAVNEMLHGWRPDTARVANYLQWLAARQWNADDFREGTVLDRLLEETLGCPTGLKAA